MRGSSWCQGGVSLSVFLCVSQQPPAADIPETHPASVLSGCGVWGNSKRLLTDYLLIPWCGFIDLFDFNNVEYLNYIHHGPHSLYTCCKACTACLHCMIRIDVLHQEEGKCRKSLVDSSWKSNCFKLIRTDLTLIIYFGGLKTSFVNKPVHKYQIIMISHEC